MHKIKAAVGKVFLYLSALFFLVIFGFPFIFVLFTSLKDEAGYIQDFWGPPKHLFFGNFQAVLQADFLTYFLNSLLVSLTTVAATIFIGSMAAYALATMKFKLNGPVLLLFLMGMMIPIHITLIPIYTLTRDLGMYDKVFGLIGPYISFALPIAIYIMTGFFKEVPVSIRESAIIDGAPPFLVYAKIMLPLSLPAVSTIGIYNFLQTWNEFIFGLTLINSASQKTLPLGIKDFYALQAVNIPAVITAIFVGSLPVMLFYFLAQEQVIQGLSSGAVKG